MNIVRQTNTAARETRRPVEQKKNMEKERERRVPLLSVPIPSPCCFSCLQLFMPFPHSEHLEQASSLSHSGRLHNFCGAWIWH